MDLTILTDAGNLALLAAFDKWVHRGASRETGGTVDFSSFRAGFVDGLRAIPAVEEKAGFDRVKDLINS